MSRMPSQDDRYLAMSWALGHILGLVSVAQTYLNQVSPSPAVHAANEKLTQIYRLCVVRGDVLVQMHQEAQTFYSAGGDDRTQ